MSIRMYSSNSYIVSHLCHNNVLFIVRGFFKKLNSKEIHSIATKKKKKREKERWKEKTHLKTTNH